MEQELLTLPGHLSSPPVFSVVRVTRSLVLYACFVDRWLSFFTFGHCVVCSSSIYGFFLYNYFVIPDNTTITMARKSIACVVAIDFGTTYSGYAFSTVEQYKKNKLDINLNPAWNSGAYELVSCKTPTTLLLTKSGKFMSYGYTAERQYENILLDKNQDENDYLYFRRFKLELYTQKVKHFLIHF